MAALASGTSAERTRGLLIIAIVYLVAVIAALLAGIAVSDEHPLLVAASADFTATVVVFAFSLGLRNSSAYDPYWSVVPPLIGLYFFAAGPAAALPHARALLVMTCVVLWSVRLTHNWARGWTGLHHEDWRYVDMQQTMGRLYWPVSFLGIHLFPTVVVFLGCLPLWPALATGTRPLGALDGVAALMTLSGVGFEFFADNQLRRFRGTNPPPGAILDSGLWSWSRHPNYFGEILFWWGLALFGLAADVFLWWTWLGAIAITAMFHFASLPLIETRMRTRRPAWDAHARRVSQLVPRPPRGGA